MGTANWDKISEIKLREDEIQEVRGNLSDDYETFIRQREILCRKKYKLEAAKNRLRNSKFKEKNRMTRDFFSTHI